MNIILILMYFSIEFKGLRMIGQLLGIIIIIIMQGEGSSSSIKVFVRVRPMNSSEKGSDEVVSVHSDNRSVRVVADQYTQLQVKFDHAFNNKATQGDIYSKLIEVVPKIMNGYNITIFAYGQTGSGKTHTMFGYSDENQGEYRSQDIQDDDGVAGIIPRAVHQIFQKVKKKKSASIFCSFLQIYNEKIYDLLQDYEKPKPLAIHQSKVEGIFVEGLTEFGVQRFEDCLDLVKKGVKNRTIRQTSMNAKSSRSHSIFQLLVEVRQQNGTFLKGKLSLCDLAGSQKINKKQAMGDAQLQELKNINLSLTTLGNVIYALSSGDKKASGAFRESKLTRILKDSLTGNTYTFIFGNLSPSSKNMDQTISTLKFVERANHITLKVKPTQMNSANPDTVDKLKKQVQYLRDLLKMKKQGINPEQIALQLGRQRQDKSSNNPKNLSFQQFQKLMKQNRLMKKQIQQLQTKIESSEISYSETSQSVNSRNKDHIDYYMPSSREPSSKAHSRVSSSLIQAGQSIVFQKNTIEDSPNRAKQKQSIAKKLQLMQDKKRYNQYKLIDDYQNYNIKKGRNNPVKNLGSSPTKQSKTSGKQQQGYQKVRKRVDYSDKIKQLQAKLFRK